MRSRLWLEARVGELRQRGKIWWMRYYRNGRRFEESARTSSYEDARDQLRRKEGAIANGLRVTPQSARYSFDEAADAITTEYTVNARRSLRDLKIRIRLHLKPWFTGKRMADIRPSDVRAYTAARLAAGAAAGQINRELAVLKRMFCIAVADEKLQHRPKIPMLREQNVRGGFFDRSQMEAVRAHLPAHLRPIITLAFLSGWRIKSEILRLEWRNVDRGAGEVHLDAGTTKNTEGRTLPYGSNTELRTLFADLWAGHEALAKQGTLCPWVFQRGGRRIKDFRGAWEKACTAAGCPGRIPHDLRRSAVRNMEQRGVPRSVAMKITGHKTESVYRRYAISSQSDLREAVAKLSGPGGDRDNFGDNRPAAAGGSLQESVKH
jgi:integrase